MDKKRKSLLFLAIRAAVKIFYPAIVVSGLENLPQSDAVVVGNHSLMNGPICAELYLPDNCYTWCAGQMMNFSEVPSYAYEDFWSQKPKILRPFYKLLSYFIAPFSVCIFNSARTVGVYHDMRSLSTFKNSVSHLKKGDNLVIFPEKNVPKNNIVYEFQERFVDIAKLYYKTSGKSLSFVPMYVAPKLKSVYIGKAVVFDPENDIDSERKRICEYLSEEITRMARELPLHKVVPYKNISKKKFVTNKDFDEVL